LGHSRKLLDAICQEIYRREKLAIPLAPASILAFKLRQQVGRAAPKSRKAMLSMILTGSAALPESSPPHPVRCHPAGRRSHWPPSPVVSSPIV